MVAKHRKWLPEYILSGMAKERVSYVQLFIAQSVTAFGCIMEVKPRN